MERAAEVALLRDATSALTLVPLLDPLPATIRLSQMATDVQEACWSAFPALVTERADQSLKLRDRAYHHLGEIERTARALLLLKRSGATTPELGVLLDESHRSLRDLYDVSTPEVEELIQIVRGHGQTLGARPMGGGFGGNVLALVEVDEAQSLIDRVQREFYSPRNRHGVSEGAVMISTPGDGLTWERVEGEAI